MRIGLLVVFNEVSSPKLIESENHEYLSLRFIITTP